MMTDTDKHPPLPLLSKSHRDIPDYPPPHYDVVVTAVYDDGSVLLLIGQSEYRTWKPTSNVVYRVNTGEGGPIPQSPQYQFKPLDYVSIPLIQPPLQQIEVLVASLPEARNMGYVSTCADLSESPIEKMFWEAHTNSKFPALDGLVQQHDVTTPDGNYRLDFALRGDLIGIELDGWEYHGQDKNKFAADRVRWRNLEKVGWRLCRFSGREVFNAADQAVTEAAAYVEAIRALNKGDE